MENLLASIRQAIDSDLGANGPAVRQPTAASIKGAMEDLRLKAEPPARPRSAEVSHEINELREKISRNRNLPAEPKTPFAQIMAGQVKMSPAQPALPVPVRPAAGYQEAAQPQTEYGHPEYTQQPHHGGYEEPAQDWQEESYAGAEYSADGGHLLSQESAYAAQSSFNELAEALMNRATGERSIEDITQELLRTMLRNWLDTNLPSLVERLVREEIERVARRGR